jgi:phosphinothricin acetyltransferase
MPEHTCIPNFHAIGPDDRESIIDLFNYYVENTFAAYPERKVPYEFFDLIIEASRGYPALAVSGTNGDLEGFGMLRPYNPMPAFSHTAEISYFIRPEMTGRGLGSLILERLEAGGKERGISSILAGISSLNEGSIRFHRRHGFTECGRFRNAGKKKESFFDVIWMQKEI